MCLTYSVAEATNCKQADVDFRGHEEIYSESGGVMDYEEDRGRPKRQQQSNIPGIKLYSPLAASHGLYIDV